MRVRIKLKCTQDTDEKEMENGGLFRNVSMNIVNFFMAINAKNAWAAVPRENKSKRKNKSTKL